MERCASTVGAVYDRPYRRRTGLLLLAPQNGRLDQGRSGSGEIRSSLSKHAVNVCRTVRSDLVGLSVALERWNLFDGLLEGPWDLVVSNPPYVEESDLPTLAPEVREWEPHMALTASGAVAAVSRGSRLFPEGCG